MGFKEMLPGIVNSPETLTTTNMSDMDTVITVQNAAVYSIAPPPFLLVLGGATAIAETVRVTAINGNMLTVERGHQGTAQAWEQGTTVAANFTEAHYRALVENIQVLNDGKLDSDKFNKHVNAVQPISKGGTGAATAAQARENLEITPGKIGAAATACLERSGLDGDIVRDMLLQGRIVGAHPETDANRYVVNTRLFIFNGGNTPTSHGFLEVTAFDGRSFSPSPTGTGGVVIQTWTEWNTGRKFTRSLPIRNNGVFTPWREQLDSVNFTRQSGTWTPLLSHYGRVGSGIYIRRGNTLLLSFMIANMPVPERPNMPITLGGFPILPRAGFSNFYTATYLSHITTIAVREPLHSLIRTDNNSNLWGMLNGSNTYRNIHWSDVTIPSIWISGSLEYEI